MQRPTHRLYIYFVLGLFVIALGVPSNMYSVKFREIYFSQLEFSDNAKCNRNKLTKNCPQKIREFAQQIQNFNLN